MPNVNAVLAQEITRLAKRVTNVNTRVTRRLVAQHRHDLAGLKRQVATLVKRLAIVEKRQPTEVSAPPEVLEKARFRAMGVKAHRAKLGLSAKDYGQLAGVSGLTIYQWESGKSRPRHAQKARWLAIRGLGKREALQQLGYASPVAAASGAKSPRKPQARGTFARTGEQSILAWLKAKKTLTTAQVNAAWRQEGRKGSADVSLSDLVHARKLKRIKIKGERGSQYKLAR